ncbi:MAG: hypothetical protein A2Z14_05360 [Chloroflexi bacterium RBG_16_48_8]|nr:MAG: hypothetical protein A2Z14_05360 [Chloroflexi bacterium RBG_16_48_8]
MKAHRTFAIAKSLVWIMLSPFLWMGLMSGLFAILTDQTTEGIIWISVVTLVLGALLQGSLLNRIEGMSLPIGSIVIFGGVTVLIGIDEVINIVHSNIKIAGEIHTPSLVALISSIGFVFIAIIVIFKVVSLIRATK